MKKFNRYMVTAALPYANGPVHIGHLAGVYIPADIYVRFLKMKGEDVMFVCGSDEHGVPITIKAKNEGITPQDVVDRYHNMIKDAFEDFGVSFNQYSRTSSGSHAETSSDFFKKLYDNGEFVEKTSKQFFDVEANQFLADRYITGTCPKCNSEDAYGDQCEKCGSSLSPTELIEPKSALSGGKPELRDTKHWFLPLDKHEPFLSKWILEDHKEWKSNVYGQCKSWIDHGLLPRAVSRDLSWGVPVPVEGAEGKVLYVWFDAPIGYITATKEATPDWEDYWKKEDSKLVHFIGKDNIVFHCIVFPSMLKAHGDYVLPENVPANEFLNLEGDKISTSKNWAVWLHEYLEEFEGMQDTLRYVLTANAPETKDNDFTWKDFQARNNNELLAVFGNYVNRVVVLTNKYYDGVVPALGDVDGFGQEVLDGIKVAKTAVEDKLSTYRFRDAMKDAMGLIRLGNKYLTETEPWKLFKTDPGKVETIMNVSLQVVANAALLFEPFLPFSSDKLRTMINLPLKGWDVIGDTELLKHGETIGKPEHLFRKIEDEEVLKQVEKLEQTKLENVAEEDVEVDEQKSKIDFDTFSSVDIRVATIIEAEKIRKTKKLLKLTVDTGIDVRTVVSGIAEFYTPEEVVGKKVIAVVNLEPRKMKGIESSAMILMADTADGKLAFVLPDGEVANGITVR